MIIYKTKIIKGESYSLIESVSGCDKCALNINLACKSDDFLCFETGGISTWIKTKHLRKEKLNKIYESNL